MRAAQVLARARNRLLQPATWGAVLLFAGFWNGLRIWVGPAHLSVGEAFFPAALGLMVVACGPLPWQWTGEDRPSPSLWRGLLQALVITPLCLLPLVWLLSPGGGRSGRPAHEFALLPGFPPRLFVLLVAAGSFQFLAGWILAERDREADRADAQERLAREAQGRALQTQMSPHVLSNTLGGLAELAREDGLAAEHALVQLAGLLRRLLVHAGHPAVTLAEERAMVEDFLALEHFRLGERLQVRWDWDPAFEQVKLPPLLLQPLVENALKHGIAPNREGGVLEIGLSGASQQVRLWVSNTGAALRDSAQEGLGLGNLRKRLALMDNQRVHFSLRTHQGRTLAELVVEPSDA